MASNKDEYMRQMMNSQQNAFNQGIASLGNFGTYSRRHPFEGVDLGSFNASEIQDMIGHLQNIFDQKTLHTPLWAPTRFQCNAHESIANAHKELCLIKKLVGI